MKWTLLFSSKSGVSLARHLRVVAEELTRSADILDQTGDDMINFYDEINKTISRDYTKCTAKQQANGDS